MAINGKLLIIASVSSNKSRTIKIASLSNLTSIIFFPGAIKELLSKCLHFAEAKVQTTEDDQQERNIIQESRYYLRK